MKTLGLFAALLLTGCATQPQYPIYIDTAKRWVDQRIVYEYRKSPRTFIYSEEAELLYGNSNKVISGNCVTFAYNYKVAVERECIRQGKRCEAEVKLCKLKSGEGHAYTVVDNWALDNMYDRPVKESEIDCI